MPRNFYETETISIELDSSALFDLDYISEHYFGDENFHEASIRLLIGLEAERIIREEAAHD